MTAPPDDSPTLNFATPEEAAQQAQRMADSSNHRWVSYPEGDGSHSIAKAKVLNLISLNDVDMEGEMVVTRRKGQPDMKVAYPS